ncbi:MAG: hypothetical protein KatS3mg109_2069 [Pirellulaceae bacterium]|nr:MAG: hypothetical protein KatS3mg109_2069 [Pirellulaceae bacterium]
MTLPGTVRALLRGEPVVLYRIGEPSPWGAWFALRAEDAALYDQAHPDEPVRAYLVQPQRVVDARGHMLGDYLADLAARTRPTCCRPGRPCDGWCAEQHRLADRVLATQSLAEDADAVIEAEEPGTAILHDDLYGDREHLSVLVVTPDVHQVQRRKLCEHCRCKS